MKDLSQLKSRLLADPDTRAEYDALGPEFAIARELIGARVPADLTQDQVAARMHTTQSAIARLESGRNHAIHALKRPSEFGQGRKL